MSTFEVGKSYYTTSACDHNCVLPFGVLLVGIGLLLFSLALVGLVFLKWAATCALPALLRNFTDFCCRIVNRGRKEGERA